VVTPCEFRTKHVAKTAREQQNPARLRHSSIIDLPLVVVQNERLISVPAWYDNEWGYATRLAEVAAYLVRK
jgi:glyceraldehyde-3-phosphate dehydrogenase/erythrose-4-phosphate dehydrogenase